MEDILQWAFDIDNDDIENRLKALLWGYPELSLLFVEKMKNVFTEHRELVPILWRVRDDPTAAFNSALEVLKSTRTARDIPQQHAVGHEMGSLPEHNEAGPSGTRHSSDHGSNTADHNGTGPPGTNQTADTIPARIRDFLCSFYEPLHTRFRAAFRVRTSHPTLTILPMANVGPTTPQVPSTLPLPYIAAGAPS